MICTPPPLPPPLPPRHIPRPPPRPCAPRHRPYLADWLENCRNPGTLCRVVTPPEFACAPLPLRCDALALRLSRCRWNNLGALCHNHTTAPRP